MYSWNVRLQDVRRLLKRHQELGISSAAVQRLKWFQYMLEHGSNVSLTCRHFGVARSTFLCWAKRFNPRDISTLEGYSRRPHTVNVPQTDERIVALIRALRTEQPMIGKEHIHEILKQKHGVDISASTIGREIARHCFFFGDTASHRRKRGETESASSHSQTVPPSSEEPGKAAFPLHPTRLPS